MSDSEDIPDDITREEWRAENIGTITIPQELYSQALKESFEEGRRQGVEEGDTPNKWIPSPKARKWIFSVIMAAGPILVFYGALTSAEVELWSGLGATILATPGAALALRNVPND